MNRRGFVASCFSLVGLGSLVPATEEFQETRHYFDYTKEKPFTTDPRYCDIISRGYHQRIYLDGEEVENVSRFVTGPEGWIELSLVKNDKPYWVDKYGVPKEFAYGLIQYRDSRIEPILPESKLVLLGYTEGGFLYHRSRLS